MFKINTTKFCLFMACLCMIVTTACGQNSEKDRPPISLFAQEYPALPLLSVTLTNQSEEALIIKPTTLTASKDEAPFYVLIHKTKGIFAPGPPKPTIKLLPLHEAHLHIIEFQPLEKKIYLISLTENQTKEDANQTPNEIYEGYAHLPFIAYTLGGKKTVLPNVSKMESNRVAVASINPNLAVSDVKSVVRTWPSIVKWEQNETPQPRTIHLEIEGVPLEGLSAISASNQFAVEMRVLKLGHSYEIVITPKDTATNQQGIVEIKSETLPSLLTLTAEIKSKEKPAN